jgi:hypothetical protein
MDTITHPFQIIRASAEERRKGELAPEQLAAVLASIGEHGAAVILDAVDLATCDRLRTAMLAELDEAARLPAALDVPGHVQHTPPPRAEHLHAELFANPIATSVCRGLLGRGIHLALYTGNTMLGHTTASQPVHWDEPQLWAGLPQAAPAHSLTINIPLVDVAEENGALELWPGTHLDVRSGARVADGLEVPQEWIDARREEVPPVRVPVPKGALLLRDGRVWHRGTTNSTPDPRPVLALVYSAWWFRALPIDFYPDAQPVLEAAGVRVTARYREDFDHLVWPPDWDLVAKPVD